MARPKDPKLAEARRDAVVDATIQLLSEASWRGVTQERVAERASVSKGVVTYWFPTKQQMLLAALDRFHERYGLELAAIVAAPRSTTWDSLQHLAAVLFPSREELAREVRFQTELWSYAKENPSALQLLQQGYAAFRVACQALLETGMANGPLATDDPARTARQIHALVDGLTLHAAFDDTLAIETVREQFLDGVRRLLSVRSPEGAAQPERAGRAES